MRVIDVQGQSVEVGGAVVGVSMAHDLISVGHLNSLLFGC
jgi:hypothetical protein